MQIDEEFFPQRLYWGVHTPKQFLPEVVIAALLVEAISDDLSLTFIGSSESLAYKAVVEGAVNPRYAADVDAVMQELGRVIEIRRDQLIAARRAGVR